MTTNGKGPDCGRAGLTTSGGDVNLGAGQTKVTDKTNDMVIGVRNWAVVVGC